MLCEIKDMAYPGQALPSLLGMNKHNTQGDQQQWNSSSRRSKRTERTRIYIVNQSKEEVQIVEKHAHSEKSYSHTGHMCLTLSILKFWSAIILVQWLDFPGQQMDHMSVSTKF